MNTSSSPDPGDFIAAVACITYGGTRYYAVKIVRRTSKSVYCTLEHPLSPRLLHLLGKRYIGGPTDEALSKPFSVPKHAIRYVPETKLERDCYEGAVYGYGGTVDVRR